MTSQIAERRCENPQCEVMFTPTRKWQKFHNGQCQQDYWAGLRDLASKIRSGQVTIKEVK